MRFKNLIFIVLSLAVFGMLLLGRRASGVSEQQVPDVSKSLQSAEEERKSSVNLERDWENEKKEYRNRFASKLVEVERAIRDLEGQLDQGDPKLRDEINERLADLRRTRDHIKQIFHEITAATAIEWGNIPGRVKDRFEDIKD
ncbi:MAG: hypothetical protein WC732_06270 [Candidatus Omnitrophota bacterium]